MFRQAASVSLRRIVLQRNNAVAIRTRAVPAMPSPASSMRSFATTRNLREQSQQKEGESQTVQETETLQQEHAVPISTISTEAPESVRAVAEPVAVPPEWSNQDAAASSSSSSSAASSTDAAPSSKDNSVELGKAQEDAAKRIFVARLHPNVTEEVLQQAFERHGKVAETSLPIDKRSGRHKGCVQNPAPSASDLAC